MGIHMMDTSNSYNSDGDGYGFSGGYESAPGQGVGGSLESESSLGVDSGALRPSSSSSFGYSPQASRAIEASLAAARSLVDPLTKVIPWEHLPKNERFYSFGPEFLPYIASSVKLRLLIESKMAWGGAGHCRKLATAVADHLESQNSYGLSLWEASDDYRDLLKKRVGSEYEVDVVESLSKGQDVVLDQWLGHYRKYLDKQLKKLGRVGVNLANIPYTAGPVEIKKAVEQLLGWEGSVSAIDPWWQKDSWNHDGTVTVYMPKVAANDLVARCEEQALMIRPVRGSGGPRIIKAWLAKGFRAGYSQQATEGSEGSVSQSLDSWS
jgi:hypothetical protein